MTNFRDIPDYSAINAAHRQAEVQGEVSPNRLPVGSIPLEEVFACMDREGAIVPVEPPSIGRKNNGFGGRGHTRRVDLVTVSPHTVLRETAGLKGSTIQEPTTARRLYGKPMNILDLLHEQPYARGIGTKSTPEELEKADDKLRWDSKRRKTNEHSDWY